jgi:hypothetical protein
MTSRRLAQQIPPHYGGWTKGKRRNADGGRWSRTLLALRAFVEDHWRVGQISYRQLATAIAVDPKTVSRWRDGIDRPSPEIQRLVAQWISDTKRTIQSPG